MRGYGRRSKARRRKPQNSRCRCSSRTIPTIIPATTSQRVGTSAECSVFWNHSVALQIQLFGPGLFVSRARPSQSHRHSLTLYEFWSRIFRMFCRKAARWSRFFAQSPRFRRGRPHACAACRHGRPQGTHEGVPLRFTPENQGSRFYAAPPWAITKIATTSTAKPAYA